MNDGQVIVLVRQSAKKLNDDLSCLADMKLNFAATNASSFHCCRGALFLARMVLDILLFQFYNPT